MDEKQKAIEKTGSLTSPIDYKIAPRVMNPDGTIEKVKVLLYKRANKKG